MVQEVPAVHQHLVVHRVQAVLWVLLVLVRHLRQVGRADQVVLVVPDHQVHQVRLAPMAHFVLAHRALQVALVVPAHLVVQVDLVVLDYLGWHLYLVFPVFQHLQDLLEHQVALAVQAALVGMVCMVEVLLVHKVPLVVYLAVQEFQVCHAYPVFPVSLVDPLVLVVQANSNLRTADLLKDLHQQNN